MDFQPRGTLIRGKGMWRTWLFPVARLSGRTDIPLIFYYGAADTSIALATGSIRKTLNWLEKHNSE